MSTKTKLKLFFGFILSVAVIYFSVVSLKGLDFSILFHTNINWIYAASSVLIFIYANYIRGYAYTHGMDTNIDSLTAFRIVGIGHAANMILPLHAGEGLRMFFFPGNYSMLARTKLLLIPGFADFVAIMFLSLLAVPFAGFKNPSLLKALWILLFLCIGGMILFAAAVYFVPRLRSYVKEYLNFGSVKMMFWVFLSWVLMLVSTWFGIAACGYGLVKSINMSLAVFAATNMINFIPASPGGIGLFEYGTILALGGLGVEQSPALAVGLLLHLLQYIALLPMGVVLYISAIHGKYGESLREVMHLKRK
jgi:glycosyltransferase 2 family protein